MSRALLDAYQRGDPAAGDELVHEHRSLVSQVVSRLAVRLPPTLDREDLVEVGYLGLLAAARTFDGGRETPFEAYATRAIRAAVVDELRRLDVLPRSRRSAVREYERVRALLRYELEREPSFLEIQQQLGLSAAELEEVLRARAVDLDAQADGACAQPSGPIDPQEPIELAAQRESVDRLATALAALPERERDVVVLYYQGGLYLRQIGEVLQLTESRVSQILHHALVTLNHRLGSRDGEASR